MDRWKLLVPLAALLCPGVILVGSAQDQLTIDATKQPSPPPRGRGPFFGSASPGHSPGLPIRLELKVPTGELRPDGTTLIDFMITNVGTEPITLPISVDLYNSERTDLLTLWLTGDVKDWSPSLQIGRQVKSESVGTSAELYGHSNDPQTFHVLTPNETIRVHASSRVWMKPGSHSLTGHAELARVPHGTIELVGTSDSKSVTKTLSFPTAH